MPKFIFEIFWNTFNCRPEELLSVLEDAMVDDSTGITEALDINKFDSVSEMLLFIENHYYYMSLSKK